MSLSKSSLPDCDEIVACAIVRPGALGSGISTQEVKSLRRKTARRDDVACELLTPHAGLCPGGQGTTPVVPGSKT